MIDPDESISIATGQIQDYLVVTLQNDLTDTQLLALRGTVLERLQRYGLAGVVLDLSGVSVLDLTEFDALRELGDMTRLLGASTVMVGLNPGIVSFLIGMDAATDDIIVARGLEDGLERLRRERAKRAGRGES